MQQPYPIQILSQHLEAVVDHRGNTLVDAGGAIVGFSPQSLRVVFPLTLNESGGNLTLRYRPPHPPGERCIVGMDYSYLIPPGASLDSGTLFIGTNTVPPLNASPDWAAPNLVQVHGRMLYATLSGGVDGTDYQLTWTAIDTDGNTWPRTALMLCAATS